MRHMGIVATIDPDHCIGSLECNRIAAEAFGIDDESGVSRPLPGVRSTDRIQLIEAANSCPTQAIRLVDDGTVLFEGAT